MVQTGLGFSAAKAHKSPGRTLRRPDTIVSDRKWQRILPFYNVSNQLHQHNHIIFERVLNECPPNFHPYISWTFASAPPGLSPIIGESHTGEVRRSQFGISRCTNDHSRNDIHQIQL
ncbi:unnamed protein product [Rotaria magnacalcarata]|uniref:Uncharacterized protein n=1 Tax=Rotaria magnacalcarata TaxID=392030 RepID=A0A8S2PBT8_9BILA|nr:unnamed protein product [Rotaria magnacalcarata]CAF4147700.1 unnamed protein product [Rotaria magnacalcarata]